METNHPKFKHIQEKQEIKNCLGYVAVSRFFSDSKKNEAPKTVMDTQMS